MISGKQRRSGAVLKRWRSGRFLCKIAEGPDVTKVSVLQEFQGIGKRDGPVEIKVRDRHETDQLRRTINEPCRGRD